MSSLLGSFCKSLLLFLMHVFLVFAYEDPELDHVHTSHEYSLRVEEHPDYSVAHVLIQVVTPYHTPHPHPHPAPPPPPPSISLGLGVEAAIDPIELHKLRNAAINAGLSEVKAHRVRRAAEYLGLNYGDVVTLRKVYNDPSTSANYADWIRKALERRYIQEEYQRALAGRIPTSPLISVRLPHGITLEREELERLRNAAKLSGLKSNELSTLMKTIMKLNLSKDQIIELEHAIVEHGAGPVDMKQLMEHIITREKSN